MSYEFVTYLPMNDVIISNVKEIRFWNSYLPTSLHNVMRYPVYFFRASLNTLILSICVCCLIFSSVHSSSAVTRFCNKIVPFPSLQVMQALWVSDVNDYILGSNFNIKGIIEKNKGLYWGAEFESWISSAPCYTLEKKHATINWTIHM